MSVKTALFLRHGETELNRDGDRFCGDLDPGLSPEGIAQARDAAKSLKRMSLTPFTGWASPRRRAQQTAEQLTDVPSWKVVEDLRELSFGSWEGLTKEACRQRDAEAFDSWVEDPYTNRPDKGESGREAQPRIDAVLKLIEQAPQESIVIVSHKSFLRFLFCSILGIPPATARQRLQIRNGAISAVEWHNGEAMLTMLNGCTVD